MATRCCTHHADLLGVLQVEAVALGHAAVDGHLDPHHLVHQPAPQGHTALRTHADTSMAVAAAPQRAVVVQAAASACPPLLALLPGPPSPPPPPPMLGPLHLPPQLVTPDAALAALHATYPHGAAMSCSQEAGFAAGLRGVAGRHSLIAPSVEEVQRELVLCVDDPHKEEAVVLQLRHRQVGDVIVRQLAVAERDAARGVGGGQLPRRVHHDDVELARRDERAPVVGDDVGVDGDAVRRDLRYRAHHEVACGLPSTHLLYKQGRMAHGEDVAGRQAGRHRGGAGFAMHA